MTSVAPITLTTRYDLRRMSLALLLWCGFGLLGGAPFVGASILGDRAVSDSGIFVADSQLDVGLPSEYSLAAKRHKTNHTASDESSPAFWLAASNKSFDYSLRVTQSHHYRFSDVLFPSAPHFLTPSPRAPPLA